MLVKIRRPNEVDDKKLMKIYAEGNLENADYFYPQITDKAEAISKVEQDFCNYIKTEFLSHKRQKRYKIRLHLFADYFFELWQIMPKTP